MNWKKVGALIEDVAPVLGGLLGLPEAAAIGGIIAHALGVKPHPSVVAKAVLTDPASIVKIKQIEASQGEQLAAISAHVQLAQIGVNRMDAESGSFWQAGWRPAVGWICASALAWQYIVSPMIVYAAAFAGATVTPPVLDDSMLQYLLFGLLGIAYGSRSLEKLRGVA